MKITITALVLVLSLIAAVGISAGFHGDHNTQATAHRTATDGNVPDPNESIPVVGPDGNLIVCPQDGKRLHVTLDEANHAPQLGDAVHEPSPTGGDVYRVTETTVPRCGTGGGDAPAVWVPEDVGAKRVTAPARFR